MLTFFSRQDKPADQNKQDKKKASLKDYELLDFYGAVWLLFFFLLLFFLSFIILVVVFWFPEELKTR